METSGRWTSPHDCWLDPYGNVYYVLPFGHNDFAMQTLSDEFPIHDIRTWIDSPDFHISYDETLQMRGWIRFTTTMCRWSCEHCMDFEEHYPRPTNAQIDRMWELTGFNYYDHNSWTQF